MPKVEKTLDLEAIGQLNLFDIIKKVSEVQKPIVQLEDIPGKLNIDATLRELVSIALKHTKFSRYEVAAKMSKLVGREITKSQIDTWSAESKENHRFPLAYLNAFIESTGDTTILRLICEKAGGYFIIGKDALKLELGKTYEQLKELSKKKKLIENALKGSL